MADGDRDIFAAEYVLGALDAGERAEAERLRAEEAEFAAAVEAWEQRLSPLAEATPPVEPPAALRERIEAAVRAHETARDASRTQAGEPSRIDALKKSLAAWRTAAVGAAAAAAAIALAWFAGLEPPLREPAAPARYVAMLEGQQGETGFVVTMEMEDRRFIVRPVAAEAPAPSKTYELWVMRKGGKAPLTLGLVGTGDHATVEAPATIDHAELEQGLELCITLEGPSGAPSGQQMGEIVFAGNLVRQTP